VYTSLPISYYQSPDWNRINWDAPDAIDIKDNPAIKKVYVMAALDGATEPTHMLTWDYTNGPSETKVQYSLDIIQNYDIGAMEVVRNGLSGMPVGVPQTPELWLGSSSEQPILRR